VTGLGRRLTELGSLNGGGWGRLKSNQRPSVIREGSPISSHALPAAHPARRARREYPSLRAVDRRRALALSDVQRAAGAALHAVRALRRLPNL